LWGGTIAIAKVLGKVDEIINEMEKKIKLLPKTKIGSRGQILEWTKEYEEWEAGHRHAMFFITHKKIDKALRLFSISSCPSENKIAFTTKIGENPSDYKKPLLELRPTMKMTLRGPMGPFVLQQVRTNCFIVYCSRSTVHSAFQAKTLRIH
jgi:predicted ferric reductase